MSEEKSQKQKKSFFYKMIVALVRIFYRKRKFIGTENLPSEPALIIGNHAQLHSPVTCELFFPTKKSVWCIGQMMNIKEVPAYAFEDFWSKKPKYIRWFFRLVSYLIAPLSAFIFTQADTIPVYKDSRILTTFRKTQERLALGEHVVIFPEKKELYNEIVNDFQDKFVDVARLYYSKHKKRIAFVPMYNAVKLKTVAFGKPIVYDPEIPMDEQRKIICEYLKAEITALAKTLPRHKVVPYLNVGAKNYPYTK